jgi:peptidyl-prolyl cis-trans isomerase C
MLRPIYVAVLAALLVSVPARAQGVAQAAAAPSAATVNGVAISHATLDAALRQAMAAGAKDTAELRSALKSQLIARELFRQEAAKQNLASDAEVLAVANQAKEATMVQKYLRGAIKPTPVSDAQIRAQYDKIVGLLGLQEYKPRMIQVADEAAAKTVLAQLKSGKAFAQLASQHSNAPSAKAGGALDWVSFKTPLKEGATQNVPLPLAEALVKLTPGMVSAAPIQWNGAYYLLQLDEVRATQIPQFEQVKPALTRALQQRELERASAALAASLLKNAKISQ